MAAFYERPSDRFLIVDKNGIRSTFAVGACIEEALLQQKNTEILNHLYSYILYTGLFGLFTNVVQGNPYENICIVPIEVPIIFYKINKIKIVTKIGVQSFTTIKLQNILVI